MKSVFFQTGERILKQVLDWLQTSKEEDVTERITDYTSPGILKNLLNEFDIIPGTNNTAGNPSIWVKTGGAYDSTGNRVSLDDENINYDLTRINHTTDNGLGINVATPYSSGSKNILLTTSQLNYVWIEYLQITDDSVFTTHKITRERLYYKKTNGYKIVVTLTNTPPTSNSLLLGHVDLTTGGAVTLAKIFKTGRAYSANLTYRTKIQTVQSDKSDRTFTYNYNEEHFVDDHVKAVGSGTPSPTNPHGLTIADLGGGDLSVQGHQIDEHTGGIIGALSSFDISVTQVDPGLDFINIAPLDPLGAVIMKDGKRYTTIFNSVSFGALDPIGIWYIYIDSVDAIIKKTQSDPSNDNTKLLLYTLEWQETVPGDFDLVNLTDWRPFGSIGVKDVQYNHICTKGDNSDRPGNPKPGQLYVNDQLGTVERYSAGTWDNLTNNWVGAGWEQIATNHNPDNVTLQLTPSNQLEVKFFPSLLPTGVVMAFGGSSAPIGWLLCDGSAVSRTTYANLFALIGITYGSGDGFTTFNTPNLVNKMPIGSGGLYAPGAVGGNKDATLPTHNHSVNLTTSTKTLVGDSTHMRQSGGSSTGIFSRNTYSIDGDGGEARGGMTLHVDATHNHTVTGNTGTQGASPIDANLPPYQALTFIIKT